MHRVELAEGVAEIERDEWNALVGEGSPFLEWEWLASLEEAGAVGGESGWQPSPLLIREGERLVAACPLYLKHNSEGEFVFDWGWADAAERAGIRYYPKLLVGVPFTPVTGSRFLVAAGEDRSIWIRRLGEALRELCIGNQLSGVHINFCPEEETLPFADSEYQLRMGLQYHWINHDYGDFEDYLARFRSKRRNQIRRERRAMGENGIEIEVVTGDDISDDLFAPMFHCYRATVDAHYYGRRYLNPRVFELMRERFRHRLCFTVARKDGEVIAGTTNVQKGNTLYGRYWGALRPEKFLHFNVCYYAAIEHCIRHGIQRFEPGAGGDYKWLRGFDAQPTYSLHFLSEPRLARAIGSFLDRERAEARRAIHELQQQSVLKKSTASTNSP